MARIAFVMKLKPGCEEICKQKHDEIWPELVESMRRRGTRNYSIYRHGCCCSPISRPTIPTEAVRHTRT